ncbi:uncharacterized protein isoform X2 [Danio rerio]|uniref:Uncharacterized protein isoform X2 n=1 Tax=Danio rerio TaxID=7955 RepID=A0AB32T7S8_DANRE
MSVGIMSGQKLNVLRLIMMMMVMICCLTGRITSNKIMIIRDNLTDPSGQSLCESAYPGLNVTCPQAYEILIGKFCMMHVKPNSSSIGYCKSSTTITHTFNILNNGGEYTVLMNDTGAGIQMWFLQNTSELLQCDFLKSTGFTSNLTSCITTQTTGNPNTTTESLTTTQTTGNPNTTTESLTTTQTTGNPNTTTESLTTTQTTGNPNTTTESLTTTQTTGNPNTTTESLTTTQTTGNPNSTCTNKACTFKGCLNIRNVDPAQECTNAPFSNDTCIGKEGNRYFLHYNGSAWTCVSCIDDNSTTTANYTNNCTTSTPTTQSPTTSSTPHITPTQSNPYTTAVSTVSKPEMMVNITPPTISADGTIDPSKASEVLNNLKSLLDDIKNSNKSNAGIKTGDIIGVIQLQDEKTNRKDVDICYSSQQDLMNVVETNQKTDFPWSVKVPSEAFDKSSLENNGSAFVGVLRYPNMVKEDETKNYTVLNNMVYGITMGANISNLNNNIEMTIKLKTLVGNASCTSWDGNGNLKWTMFGCETEMIDNNTIKCSCSHLTFFAVLMSVPDASAVAPYLDSLTHISSVGCGISVFFLAIALFMHFLLRKAKSNQATKILINILVALFLLNVSFLSNESVANSGDKNACVFIALLMHYSMLTSFTWFFIQALHMYLWLIRQNVTITNYMRKITMLGWGFSTPIVVVILSIGGYKTLTLNSTSGKIVQMCWITDLYIQYIVNIGFYSLVFIFTTFIFIIIVTKIFQSRDIRATEGKRLTFKKQLMMVLSLFFLFGLTWAVAFFSYGPMLIPSYYIFSVLNSFQGFFLFLYYYHIHNDAAGSFSDDPGSSSTTTSIVKSSNPVGNLYN